MSKMDEEIVIVGGGICGIATALALSRKGIRSVVLEKSETLRVAGVAIIIQANGWRALEQLGVASKLRQTAIPLTTGRQVLIGDGAKPMLLGKGEMRILKRKVLVETLAASVPPNTVRFGCQVVSISVDPSTSFPVLVLQDGTTLKPKIVIGCDGLYSIVANFLNVNQSREFASCSVRGVAEYPNGHNFGNEFVLVRNKATTIQLGRLPMTDTLVYWFIARRWIHEDSTVSKDVNLIKKSTVHCLKEYDFPEEYVDMIKNSETDSLHLTPRLRYRVPWEMVRKRFYKGTVVVAGDSMHAMAPFLGQGGSAALEDAVVMARYLKEVADNGGFNNRRLIQRAFERFVKERKMRVVKLCTQTFLIGTLLDATSRVIKFLVILLMMIFFRDFNAHCDYNCGVL